MAVDGTWKMTISTDDIDPEIVPREATMTLKADGKEVSGSMEGPYPMGEGVVVAQGTLEGDSIAWIAAMRGERLRPQELQFTGTVGADEITGEVEVGIFGTATFRAVPA